MPVAIWCNAVVVKDVRELRDFVLILLNEDIILIFKRRIILNKLLICTSTDDVLFESDIEMESTWKYSVMMY